MWSSYKLYKSDANYNLFQQARRDYRNTCRLFRGRYRQNQVTNLCLNMNNNSRRFWATLRNSTRKSQLPNISDDELFRHFSQLNGTEPNTIFPFDDIIRNNLDTYDNNPDEGEHVLNCEITEQEIGEALSQLKQRKAAGVDKLIPELFIHSGIILLPYLKHLFQNIFSSGSYPKRWAEGMLHLIYKKGNRDDPNNYRDITLMSCFGKLFDQVMYNRLSTWEKEQEILHEEQAGFRSSYSTVDHIFTLQSLISASVYNRSKLYCGFIDFRKAFNSVYRNGLWSKLIGMGCTGKMLTII